jgi:polysaccharide transporter, PST family
MLRAGLPQSGASFGPSADGAAGFADDGGMNVAAPRPDDAGAVGAATKFGSAVLTGFSWKIASILVSEGTRVVVAIVLARLLTPADYGVAGMAFIFAGLAALFSDLALGGALVQRRDLEEADRSTAFWASLAFSLVVMAVAIGLSDPVADFFGRQQVQALVIGLSFSFPLAALSTTQTALLTRELAYRSLEIRQIVGVLCGGVVALVLAGLGTGPWAIIGNALAASAASTLLLWRFSDWRPQRVFSRRHLGHLSSFGLRLFGLRLLNYGNLNMDNTLIGRFAGASALGVYSLAYNVVFTPLVRIASPISDVVYPALARMQDDLPRMRSAWLRSKQLSAALLAPSFLAIAVVAPDLVRVLFGAKWHAAVPVIQLLCIAGVAHSLVTLNWTVLQATAKLGVALRLDFFVTVATIGAFAVGVKWGAIGVAAAYASIKWPAVLVDTYVTTRALRFGFLEALRASCSTLAPALLAAAGAYGLRAELVSGGVPAAARLVIVLAVGLVLYLALLLLAAPTVVAEARAVLRERRGGASRRLPRRIEARLTGGRGRRHPPEQARRFRLSQSQERLLAAALGDPDDAVAAWRGLPPTFSLDVLEPGSFELLPLVYRNLAEAGYDDPGLPRLKGIYRRSWVKNNLLLRRTCEISETLHATGVRPLFLEGATLAARYYPELGLRPTSTVHLLVRPQDERRALSRLERGGWQARPGSGAFPGYSLLFDARDNICALRAALAYDFVDPAGGSAEAALWNAAQMQDVSGNEVLVPTPTDALLAVLVGGARRGPIPRTQWVTDAALIIRAAEIDWDRLLELGVEHGQTVRLREALRYLLSLPDRWPPRLHDGYQWLLRRPTTRRETLGYSFSSGSLARLGGFAEAIAEHLAATDGDSPARTVRRFPARLRERWGLAHSWQLPLALGRRMIAAAARRL